jgi:hypothetical protein
MHSVNVVPNFMVENFGGNHAAQDWNPPPPIGPRFNSIVDMEPNRGRRTFPRMRLGTQTLGHANFSISTPNFLPTFISGQTHPIGG